MKESQLAAKVIEVRRRVRCIVKEGAGLFIARPRDIQLTPAPPSTGTEYRNLIFPGQRGIYAEGNASENPKARIREWQQISYTSRHAIVSNRLVEVAQRCGTEAQLIESAAEILAVWLDGRRSIGITAGACTPEIVVSQVVNHLNARGFCQIEQVDIVDENGRFALPPGVNEA